MRKFTHFQTHESKKSTGWKLAPETCQKPCQSVHNIVSQGNNEELHK